MNSTQKKVTYGVAGAVTLIFLIGLIGYHLPIRSTIKKCETEDELYYVDPITNTGSCLKAYTKGPCGNNMLLVPESHRIYCDYGVCECNTKQFHRPMIFHEKSEQCYFIFTKAYCDDGEWVTIQKNKGPICERRRCAGPEDHEVSELVPLSDGRCVKLGSFDSETCSESQVIRFFKEKIYPSCIDRRLVDAEMGLSLSSIGVPRHKCGKGYYSTNTGKCQPDFEFE